ncbi:MAG: 4-hydroxythreonine-4-phosphate dehydrogenase PdxA [bacterium]|nr:4-hydroxythreonine-4-phosphate dehydrogenase PdxA [bacterium]
MSMKPTIGITMGDASGIGPEVIIKSLKSESIRKVCNPLIIGDTKVIKKVTTLIGTKLDIDSIDEIGKADFKRDTLTVLDLDNIPLQKLKIGEIDEISANASLEYIKKGVELALHKEIQALVTAPVSKEAISKTGVKFSGHTELLARLTNTRHFAMMFVSPELKVVLATIHVPLKKVKGLINKEHLLTIFRLTNRALIKNFGINHPHIGVCGLNPHAGEGGVFGKEEKEEIRPAICSARDLGIDIDGPYPADTLFYKTRQGEFDVVVAMYHDQGLIPIKLLSFSKAVNVTLGLSIIRTSPSHGVAFDIAYKNKASPESMIEAITLAAKLKG